jgi:cytidine deaminase
MDKNELLKIAKKARERAYAPYSDFYVGAALLCVDGEIYTGCNVENASFSPTCCAERIAVFKAVSDGKQKFSAIAIVGGKKDSENMLPCYPCGVCRQVMSEFCDDDFLIVTENNGSEESTAFSDILPKRFQINN